MKAGDLRDLIQIEEKQETQSDSGEVIIEWVEVVQTYAAIEPISGREFFASQTIGSEVTTRIRIRYYPGIVTAMRVNHEGILYNVLTVLDINNRHRELHLMCSSGLTEG